MGRDKLRAYEAAKAKERETAVTRAAEMIAAGRFDEADRLVLEHDQSGQGPVTLAKLYENRLTRMAGETHANHDRAAIEAVFNRARTWAWRQYPEPHTQMEAMDAAAGRNEDIARLEKILGYELPWPSST